MHVCMGRRHKHFPWTFTGGGGSVGDGVFWEYGLRGYENGSGWEGQGWGWVRLRSEGL